MIFDVLKAITKRKADHFHEIVHGKKERVDVDFPMNIRLKCTIQLDIAPFIVENDDNLVCKYPGLDQTVEAVGRFEVGNIEFFNFYLQRMDEESILQIARDKKTKEVLEVILYREIYKIFPAPGGEFGDWVDWVDPDSGIIGSYSFGTPNGMTYEIVIPDCPGDRTKPVSCTEKITDDPLIDEIVRAQHDFAVYSRIVEAEITEKLFVSKTEDEETAFVRILAGIPINFGAGTFGNSGFITVL